MRWMILKDHISRPGERTRIGVSGGMVNPSVEEAKKLPYEFRLYDDDGNLYYEGRSDDRDSEDAFHPLDYGESDAGCVRIDYKQDDGTWETL
jgi:hypothetical protein